MISNNDLFTLKQIYMLTKDEGGAATPLTAGKQVLCYSQTWDCASYVSLPGNIAHILFGIQNVLELIS